MPFDTTTIIFITAVLLLAGFIKGVIGFGLPSISMGLLGLVMAPSQAAALLLAPNIITNILQGVNGPALVPLLKRLGVFLITTVIGALLWEYATGGKDLRWATRLLGMTLVIYALLGLFRIRFSLKSVHETWVGALCGLATGAMTIATGVFVIPSGPYLQAIGLEKDELVQALGLSFLVASLSLGLVLLMRGGFRRGAVIGGSTGSRHGRDVCGSMDAQPHLGRSVQEAVFRGIAGTGRFFDGAGVNPDSLPQFIQPRPHRFEITLHRIHITSLGLGLNCRRLGYQRIEQAERVLEQFHVRFGLILHRTDDVAGHGLRHLLAEFLLFAREMLHRMLKIARHKAFHLVAVEADELAQEIHGQHGLLAFLAFQLENDLRQHGPRDILASLGVGNREILAFLDHDSEIFKRHIGAGAGVIETPVGVFLDDSGFGRLRHHHLPGFHTLAVCCPFIRAVLRCKDKCFALRWLTGCPLPVLSGRKS
jgi:uncharacterized protein